MKCRACGHSCKEIVKPNVKTREVHVWGINSNKPYLEMGSIQCPVCKSMNVRKDLITPEGGFRY